MSSPPRFPVHVAVVVSLAAASVVAALAPIQAFAQASAQPATYPCADKGAVTRLSYPLAHMAQRIATRHSVTIVALGSSSTAGAGASGPAASYPSRLEAELKASFPQQTITVLNRGVNGDEVADMMSRFDEGVAAAHPDVVLLQVGTNAVLRDNPLGPVDHLVHEGIARIKAIGADVVLIDPQFAPKVIVKAGCRRDGQPDLCRGEGGERRPVSALCPDAGMARPRRHSVRDVPVARPSSYERLELWLCRQALVLGDGRGGDAAARVSPGQTVTGSRKSTHHSNPRAGPEAAAAS